MLQSSVGYAVEDQHCWPVLGASALQAGALLYLQLAGWLAVYTDSSSSDPQQPHNDTQPVS